MEAAGGGVRANELVGVVEPVPGSVAGTVGHDGMRQQRGNGGQHAREHTVLGHESQVVAYDARHARGEVDGFVDGRCVTPRLDSL